MEIEPGFVEVAEVRKEDVKGESELIKKTFSLCPLCLSKIEASIFLEDNKLIMRKYCEEHGSFEDIYWGDYEMYKKFMKYLAEPSYLSNPMTRQSKGCPFDCGLCNNHKSPSILANIDVTNRCNQQCPICFANAGVQGYLYEPSFDEIKEMMLVLRNEKPYPCSVLQFSGGEPTVREDLPELIRLAKNLGFEQVQIATNGVRLASSVDYVRKLKEAGLNTVYLQFDGLSPEIYVKTRGYNALPKKLKAIENCREAKLNSVVLVPTVAKNINAEHIGEIINFAAENNDVVKGVNAQPVSFSGRVDREELKKMRITIPDLLKLIEEQTQAEIACDDFYPVPVADLFSRFMAGVKGEAVIKVPTHPVCGAATYVFVDNGRKIPITRFIDVDYLLEETKSIAENMASKNIIEKAVAIAKFAKAFARACDIEKLPKNVDARGIIMKLVTKASIDALAELFKSSLFIGTMHFQDAYNFDLDRVQRCCIHYAIPGGKVIPFCSYNTIHRERIERSFAKNRQC